MKVLLEAQLAQLDRLYLVYLGFLLHPELPEFLADPVDLLHLDFLVDLVTLLALVYLEFLADPVVQLLLVNPVNR